MGSWFPQTVSRHADTSVNRSPMPLIAGQCPMPMVFSPHMTQTSPPADQRTLLGSIVFALGAVCLVIVWLGLGRIAYDVVVNGVLSGLFVKFLVLTVVYAFGVGLGSVSRTRFENPVFPRLTRVYAW